jgi:hypothetical protein
LIFFPRVAPVSHSVGRRPLSIGWAGRWHIASLPLSEIAMRARVPPGFLDHPDQLLPEASRLHWSSLSFGTSCRQRVTQAASGPSRSRPAAPRKTQLRGPPPSFIYRILPVVVQLQPPIVVSFPAPSTPPRCLPRSSPPCHCPRQPNNAVGQTPTCVAPVAATPLRAFGPELLPDWSLPHHLPPSRVLVVPAPKHPAHRRVDGKHVAARASHATSAPAQLACDPIRLPWPAAASARLGLSAYSASSRVAQH